MYQIVNQSDFVSAFKQSERKNQFSYAALCAIFDHITEIEESDGNDIEFDLVSICCDWCEYSSAQEAAQAYGWKPDNHIEGDGNECDGEAMQFLNDSTQVIELKGGAVVIYNF
jgi:hypothetical protein